MADLIHPSSKTHFCVKKQQANILNLPRGHVSHYIIVGLRTYKHAFIHTHTYIYTHIYIHTHTYIYGGKMADDAEEGVEGSFKRLVSVTERSGSGSLRKYLEKEILEAVSSLRHYFAQIQTNLEAKTATKI